MNNPLVSVILPTYNRALLLPRAIKSVLNQTYKNFELIIIDDNSTDNTKKIVDGFKDKRIKYIRYKVNKGAAASRNTGIKLAKGEYIAFQDSDDEWLPEKLEKQMKVFENLSSKYGVIYSAYWRLSNGRKKYLPFFNLNKREEDIHKNLLGACFVAMVTIVCRKECFKKVGFFDEKLPRHEDWELAIRLSKKYLFKYINEPLTNVYHQSKNSISSNADALIKSTEMIVEKYKEDIKKEQGLLSEYYFTIGNMFFAKEDFENGKRYFIKAKTLNPLTIRFLICAPIIIFVPRLYVKLLLFIRRNKNFKNL